MSSAAAFFATSTSSDGEVLVPEPCASSGWNSTHIRGPAIAGALARAAEACHRDLPGAQDRLPARITFDLFRPARMEATRARAATVRTGRRLVLVDCELVQSVGPVARASFLFLAASPATATPPTDDLDLSAPAEAIGTDHHGQAYRTDLTSWTTHAPDHANDSRKYVWREASPIVTSEPATAMTTAAVMADVSSLALHWSSRGMWTINADVTLSLSRLPRLDGVGVVARDRLAHSGFSVGSTLLFDRSGPIGFTAVSALPSAIPSGWPDT